MTYSLDWSGHEFKLLPEGAIYWASEATLLVADLHLGKDANFRASGIPIPAGSDAETLNRLDHLLATIKPNRLVILGDLFHGKFSKIEIFNQWITNHPTIEIELIVGNHDRWIKTENLNVNCCTSIERKGILLSHAPVESDLPVICGHIHPGYRFERGSRIEKLRCFWQQKSCLVMPAFGDFTGNFWLSPAKNDRIFLIAGKEVLELPKRSAT